MYIHTEREKESIIICRFGELSGILQALFLPPAEMITPCACGNRDLM